MGPRGGMWTIQRQRLVYESSEWGGGQSAWNGTCSAHPPGVRQQHPSTTRKFCATPCGRRGQEMTVFEYRITAK